jgi:LacI family transcriptional regulator
LSATQYDVARRTGLSQATISRALRGDPSVTKDTRERILAACAAVGYRPSVGARILAEGRRGIIGISLSRDALPTDRYVSLLHQALLETLDASGRGVTLLPADSLENGLARVGAVILIGVADGDPRLALCQDAGLPFVAIGYVSDPAMFSVVPDDRGGSEEVVRHVHRLGRRHLLMLSAAQPGEALGVRALAARDEAARLGLEFAHLSAPRDATHTLAGYRALRHARPVMDRCDALFCETDEYALGALAALRDAGIQVPSRITVAGFDDLPGMATRLTTVRQSFSEIARAAVCLRDEAVRGAPGRRVVVPVELIVRET